MIKLGSFKITEQKINTFVFNYGLCETPHINISERTKRLFLVEIREYWDKKYSKRYIKDCSIKRDGRYLIITNADNKSFRKVVGGKNLRIFHNNDVVKANSSAMKAQKKYIGSLQEELLSIQRDIDRAEKKLASMILPELN